MYYSNVTLNKTVTLSMSPRTKSSFCSIVLPRHPPALLPKEGEPARPRGFEMSRNGQLVSYVFTACRPLIKVSGTADPQLELLGWEVLTMASHNFLSIGDCEWARKIANRAPASCLAMSSVPGDDQYPRFRECQWHRTATHASCAASDGNWAAANEGHTAMRVAMANSAELQQRALLAGMGKAKDEIERQVNALQANMRYIEWAAAGMYTWPELAASRHVAAVLAAARPDALQNVVFDLALV